MGKCGEKIPTNNDDDDDDDMYIYINDDVTSTIIYNTPLRKNFSKTRYNPKTNENTFLFSSIYVATRKNHIFISSVKKTMSSLKDSESNTKYKGGLLKLLLEKQQRCTVSIV